MVPIPGRPSTYKKVVRDHYTPPAGARFNNPYGSQSSRRALLTHVTRAINSSPGYQLPVNPATGRRVACPTNPKDYPSEIKIALYSIADKAFVDALIHAHQRCVSVKLLMNSHLNRDNSPSWRRLTNFIPGRTRNLATQRSFAARCSNGCIGSTVLHTKFYLFSAANSARKTVMVGSSNMTTNAVRVQWNDLFTVNGSSSLYSAYRSMFTKMAPDRRGSGPRIYHSGPYVSTFYPFRTATRTTDKTMNALNTIRCTGATGGAGLNGRTVVHIVMHSWHGKRGLYLAKRVRQLYNNGCYVRILYSFMGHGTFSLLTRNTNSRMVARRVLFAGPAGQGRREVLAHEDVRGVRQRVGRPLQLGHLDRLQQLGRPQHQGRRGHHPHPVAVGLGLLRRPLELHAEPQVVGHVGDLRGAVRRRPRPGLTLHGSAAGDHPGGPAGAVQQDHRAAADEAEPERRPEPQQPRLCGRGEVDREQRERREDREHHHPAPGEVATVPGPDQHAVQHEHHPGDRLEERRDQQHGTEQVAHLRVAGEQRARAAVPPPPGRVR